MEEKKKILEILAELRPEFDFENSSDFIEDGLLDSFDIASLISVIEERYSVKVDGLDIVPENFLSVDAIISLIEKSSEKS
ncbi:acyl carrier protein [Fibrobacter succinogenes]|uniref:Carrier domain-containing protein n=1 Tax=Fibrobacter succinogenes TaxID=833 RepID=A0A380S492_FIBSU|nr:acyl carrier protein [Fibrobacter succinogenes]PWJ35386.1 hypothetical protein IE02_1433 [Fibrobacter succinogenes subsp. elongatus]SUQ24042.1 hypothetical protein SAMN05661053_1433 [Fibrobacter succinogenes]